MWRCGVRYSNRPITPSLERPISSLVPQSHHRVHFSRPVRRNVARDQRYGAQDERDGDERERIGGFDAVKEAGQEPPSDRKRSGSL